MGKGNEYRTLKEKAKSRVDDLQDKFNLLVQSQSGGSGIDVTLVQQQVSQILKDWNNELNDPSPASSSSSSLHPQQQQCSSMGLSSAEINRLIQLCEEEDDATSRLAPLIADLDVHEAGQSDPFDKDLVRHCNVSSSGVATVGAHGTTALATGLDNLSFNFPQDIMENYTSCFDVLDLYEGEVFPQIMSVTPPPPCAFLGPKCALWDCPRPAEGGLCPDYCSNLHSANAQTEGMPGMNPVIRPKGIELKDNLLFAALSAKTQGKNVGVPECEGAATTRSPWNAPELFDISMFEGETLREWLFFDKPRRAFESGNRKQRSLPDYKGRGWHESRKQVINESGWLKRSYYMDPQPMEFLEWHLFEYETSKCDAYALYRLELKVVDGKKGPKKKIDNDPLSELQKQMSQLTAEFPVDSRNKSSGEGRGKVKGSSCLEPNDTKG